MLSWNRIAAIIRREYLERVKTKAFWISTLLVPIFLGAVMIIPAWLASRGGGTFTINADGTFAFNAGTDFDDLAALVTDFTGEFEAIKVDIVAESEKAAKSRDENACVPESLLPFDPEFRQQNLAAVAQ